jgi:hypothetical protein
LRAQFDRIAQQSGGLMSYSPMPHHGRTRLSHPFGAHDPDGAIENIPNESWMLAVNLHGVFKTIQSAVPHLKTGAAAGHRHHVDGSDEDFPAVGTLPRRQPRSPISGIGARACALQHHRHAIQPGPFQTRITTPEPSRCSSRARRAIVWTTEEIEGLEAVLRFRRVELCHRGIQY